jgi:DhnA family fructose-bisphosphate aldolase class Ia
MSGKNIKIKRFFRGKKNIIISALDHVVEYGVQPGIEDAREAISKCMATDALLLPRFMLKRNWDMFTSADSPAPVVRINWSSSFYYPLNYKEGFTTICTNVEEAVEAGAEAVICSLFLEEDNNKAMEVNNVSIFAEVVRQKEKLGIPLIGECYVVEHNEKTEQQVHDKVKRISRIMSELGADFIKTFYTGENFHEVVENTPVPVFTIGAEKLTTDLAVLEKAYNSVQQGANGIIFGRNIFMAENPPLLIKALNDVMNKAVKPAVAAEKHRLK